MNSYVKTSLSCFALLFFVSCATVNKTQIDQANTFASDSEKTVSEINQLLADVKERNQKLEELVSTLRQQQVEIEQHTISCQNKLSRLGVKFSPFSADQP